MAHIVRLGALTDELITIITGTSSKNEPSRFYAYHESTLRSLRYSNYARTNQFDVADRLEGLEEKFRVHCEDPLADALRERLDELKPRSNKWTPEILHLLLELSDKPVEKSTVASLELLYPPRNPTPPPLTWEELAAENSPLRDKHIWRNIDYTVESSDEGEYLDSTIEKLDDNETTDLSSVDDQEYLRSEELLQSVNDENLNTLLQARFWGLEASTTSSLQAKPLTELQAVREILYMLHGLPTSMFSKSHDMIRPLQVFRLKHASRAILAQHLNTFAEWGTSVSRLRSYIELKNETPLLRYLQYAITKRLDIFDALLSTLEQDYLVPQHDQVVSLLAITDELQIPVQRLSKLSNIVQRLQDDRNSHPFRYLECLYDETCVAQMAGNDEIYRFLGVLFFECFQIYLRPIRQWMEDGSISKNEETFFVTQAAECITPALLWEGRYKLRQTSEGGLHAPRFIQAATDRIFNTGKSIIILQHLGRYENLKASWTTTEPRLDFDTVCGDSFLELAPFSALFDVAFGDWIQSKHHFTSTTLQQCLFEDCGLWASIRALETIYFMRDGASSSFLASTIFSKLDSLKDSWNDSFSLTELAQTTYASTPFIIEDRIRAISPVGNNDLVRSRRSVKHLSSIAVEYRLSWPVQLIITPKTMPSYQRIFTFLLQIRRSASFLNYSRLSQDVDNEHSSADERALYYSTRARLLWFTNLLHNYITDIVLEKCTSQMRSQLRVAEDVDEMITIHRKCLKKMEDQALLGRKLGPIHKSIISLLDLSIQLVDARKTHLNGKDPEAEKTQLEWNSDSEPEEEDSFVEKVVAEVGYGEELRAIRKRYESMVRFVASGLRGVARVGGEGVAVWDILAEKIEVGLVP